MTSQGDKLLNDKKGKLQTNVVLVFELETMTEFMYNPQSMFSSFHHF